MSGTHEEPLPAELDCELEKDVLDEDAAHAPQPSLPPQPSGSSPQSPEAHPTGTQLDAEVCEPVATLTTVLVPVVVELSVVVRPDVDAWRVPELPRVAEVHAAASLPRPPSRR